MDRRHSAVVVGAVVELHMSEVAGLKAVFRALSPSGHYEPKVRFFHATLDDGLCLGTIGSWPALVGLYCIPIVTKVEGTGRAIQVDSSERKPRAMRSETPAAFLLRRTELRTDPRTEPRTEPRTKPSAGVPGGALGSAPSSSAWSAGIRLRRWSRIVVTVAEGRSVLVERRVVGEMAIFASHQHR